MTQPGIKLKSPGPLSNTLPTTPMSPVYIYIYIYIYRERERDGGKAKHGIIFQTFSSVWLAQFLKKCGKSKSSLLVLFLKILFIKIQPCMRDEQGKQLQWIYDPLNAKTNTKYFQNNWIFYNLYRDVNPLDYTIWGV